MLEKVNHAANKQEMARIADVPWLQDEKGLHRTFTFTGFRVALGFVVEAGKLAETAQHHPDIDVRWNKVHLTLVTHDAGHSVTARDHALAAQIDRIALESIMARAAALW